MKVIIREPNGIMIFAAEGVAAHYLIKEIMKCSLKHRAAKDPNKHTIYEITGDTVLGIRDDYKIYLWVGSLIVVSN